VLEYDDIFAPIYDMSTYVTVQVNVLLTGYVLIYNWRRQYVWC